MTHGVRLSASLLLVLGLCASTAPLAKSASERLATLAAETWEKQLDLEPVLETYWLGAGPRQGRLEIQFSARHRERERALNRGVLEKLRRIPVAQLGESERITHRLMEYDARTSLEALDWPLRDHALLSQFWGGLASGLVFLAAIQPFRNESDYAVWMSRLGAYPGLLDEARKTLEGGVRSGITAPAVLVRASLKQWEAIAPDDGDPARSSLWRPIAKFPATIDAPARERIEARYRLLLGDQVFPAMRRFMAFARDEYLPKARTSDGIDALPRGAQMYRFLVRQQTTTDLSPDEIHELGLKEVRRIQMQLLVVATQAGFKGEMRDFGGWINALPENFPFKSGDEVLEHLREVNEARIVPQLPRLFNRLPKAGFEIRLTEPELAPTAAATYSRAPDDGSRPAVFRIPVVDARRRNLSGLRSLLAHEGMPGHHFDNGLAAELKVPDIRKYFRTVAFGEGWALYAESLGHAMGLYDEPLSLMGRYMAELFRAARLVVDTGLHSKGWTRERAIRYLMEEAGAAEANATSEIQRYMANPAQALGYKIGELAILDLRARAERRLGDAFDIRAFHDALLAEGHMPLTMLRARMEAWMDAEARRGKKP